MLVAGALICAVGVLDDIFELDALTKLGGQVLAVGLAGLLGRPVPTSSEPDGIQFALDPAQGALLTALIVVGARSTR